MATATQTATQLWVLQPTGESTERLDLTADGRHAAEIHAPWDGSPVRVTPQDGRAWRVEAYGKGWKLVARTDDEQAEPLLWFTGRLFRSGGPIVVAPDRHYDLRSRILKRLDAHIEDEQGDLLLEAHAIPRHDREGAVEVTVHRPHHDDAVLLATFAAVHGVLVYRQGRHQYGYGLDGAP